jgi:hypothetical protein
MLRSFLGQKIAATKERCHDMLLLKRGMTCMSLNCIHVGELLHHGGQKMIIHNLTCAINFLKREYTMKKVLFIEENNSFSDFTFTWRRDFNKCVDVGRVFFPLNDDNTRLIK